MERLSLIDSGLTKKEYAVLKSLSTPSKTQNFLDTLPFNYEKKGETQLSPREVMREKKALCMEGAVLAATAFWIAGERPLVMNLSARLNKGDCDHVVALYKRGKYWGAISKTNHSVLRFRDPVYRTLRELALSYFHEWFLPSGEKTLECYSRPLDLSRFGTEWITRKDGLWDIAEALGELPHYDLVPKGQWRYIRPADKVERESGLRPEWKKSNPRT
jgi:hypothetical protein